MKTPEEFDLAHSIAKSTPLKIVFLVLLKASTSAADQLSVADSYVLNG